MITLKVQSDTSLHANEKDRENIYIGTYIFNRMIVSKRKAIKNKKYLAFSNNTIGMNLLQKNNNNLFLFESTKHFFGKKKWFSRFI